MVQLTPHDSAVLSRLVQFGRLPAEKRKEILSEVESAEARMVGEVVLDPQRYSESTPEVRATVDRFQEWSRTNRRLGRHRTAHRRPARTR
jgi:hypothetical protein